VSRSALAKLKTKVATPK